MQSIVKYNNNEISINKENCSETARKTALKIVRERVVSPEAQTRTSQAKITAL